MQSFSSPPARRPRLLVLELWGVGDVALAVPFLRNAAKACDVTLLAKPHAVPIVRRFCPEVKLVTFRAPWTALRGKYRLLRWPWRELFSLVTYLRRQGFDAAVSARPDPRDHALMLAAGARTRAGFPRAGSRLLLNLPVTRPVSPHRAAYWDALTEAMSLPAIPETPVIPTAGRRILIHTGAAQPTREWPRERFEEIGRRLADSGWQVTLRDGTTGRLDDLLQDLAATDRFLGNDSGPGHLAALSGVPTFTIFGAQLAANFSPVHPQAAWVDGAPCPFKPCNDYCRFAEPHCIRGVTVDAAWGRITAWLAQSAA